MCQGEHLTGELPLASSKVNQKFFKYMTVQNCTYMYTMYSTIKTTRLHTHTCSFIPGTSASDVHYQAYLIDGITRWNNDRASAFLSVNTQSPRTLDIALQQKIFN